EVGCSIGVLTRLLAAQCDSLLGVDIVEEPLAAARARCADQPWVRFQRLHVPQSWPDGQFDLIVLSEVLYFLSAADIDRCARHVAASLSPAGTVVLVNWLGQADDPTTGHEAAERFIASSGLPVIRQEQTSGYRLDLLSSPPA
ncbi:MAG TPA: class I SAM-dependent methyltransferase, partial [Rhodopila sp.]|nr:class I SAM-dependent methyltransferase [Rhodopila sp.]